MTTQGRQGPPGTVTPGDDSTTYDDLDEALIVARREERVTGNYRWVTRDYEGIYRIEDRIPLLGEFYDAQGYRQG